MPNWISKKYPPSARSSNALIVTLAVFPDQAVGDDIVWRLSLENTTTSGLPHSSLYDVTSVDLNNKLLRIATRRDSCSHFLQKLDAEDNYIFAHDAQQCLLYCVRGGGKFVDAKLWLANGELVQLDETGERSGIDFHLRAAPDSQIFLVRISYFS